MLEVKVLGVEILTNFHQNAFTNIIDHIDSEWHKWHSLFKIDIKNDFIFGWLLKSLISIISPKGMTMTMLQYEEATISRAQQFDFSYS